jgi:hypothetical protein
LVHSFLAVPLVPCHFCMEGHLPVCDGQFLLPGSTISRGPFLPLLVVLWGLSWGFPNAPLWTASFLDPA